MSVKNLEESMKTWNKIAKSFDQTRKKTWGECIEFIDSFSQEYIIADIACGNGRHLIPASKNCKIAIGLDLSIELLKIVNEKINNNDVDNVVLVNSDACNIPLKSNTLDGVLFIAALHNIKGQENRIKALSETKRVLKKDSKALISVWSRWQEKYRKEFFKKFFKSFGQDEFGDIDIYWRQHGLNIPRFYHLYSKREFKNDLIKAGFEIVDFKELKMTSQNHADNFFAVVK